MVFLCIRNTVQTPIAALAVGTRKYLTSTLDTVLPVGIRLLLSKARINII